MTPLVLLPGMMCDARLFGPQNDALSGRCPLATFPIGAHPSMLDLASDILNHAPPRFCLAGLSFGGIVAMEIARQAPERVERLALLDTNHLAEQEDIRTRRLDQIDRVRSGALQAIMRDEMKPNYLGEFAQRDTLLNLCMTMATGLGPEVFINQSHALRDRRDQTETLQSLSCPTLVLCGSEDSLCPVARHRMMHDLMPQSRLVIVQGAGHLTTLEKPDETTAALLDWLGL